MNVFGGGAHTSLPHHGENALEKAVLAVCRILELSKSPATNDLLDDATIAVSMMQSGTPDLTRFSLRARTVPAGSNATLLDMTRACLDVTATIEV